MLNEIINNYFEEEVPRSVWDLHDEVENYIAMYKAGDITAEQLDEIVARYVYEAEKRAIKWTYAQCSMAVFGHLMREPEDLPCCRDCAC